MSGSDLLAQKHYVKILKEKYMLLDNYKDFTLKCRGSPIQYFETEVITRQDEDVHRLFTNSLSSNPCMEICLCVCVCVWVIINTRKYMFSFYKITITELGN